MVVGSNPAVPTIFLFLKPYIRRAFLWQLEGRVAISKLLQGAYPLPGSSRLNHLATAVGVGASIIVVQALTNIGRDIPGRYELRLVAGAGIRQGSCVLDVACATGVPAPGKSARGRP